MTDNSEYRFPFSIKVLVAEDNEMNKLLVTSVLSNWGVEYSVASNGIEAVDLMEQYDFDVILMDIQMPEKDGIEATTDIRNFWDERKKNIPIIALTANAVKGEEQKYFDAGMNGFLTKPFKEKELFELIATTIQQHQIKYPAIEKNTDSTVLNKSKHYNLSLIEELMSGDRNSVQMIVQTFVLSIPPSVIAMQKACDAKDWLETAKNAHGLKANIDTLQIDLIHNDIKTIEVNGKQGIDLESIPALVSKVKVVIEETILQLKQEFDLQ